MQNIVESVSAPVSVRDAIGSVFGRASVQPLGDPYRASFRRRALRQGGMAGALAAMLTRLAAILFVIGPRDLGQVFIALLWSLVAELPSLLIHAIGGALAGVVLTALLLLAGGTLYTRIGRNATTLSACLALLSCLLFGVAAALLRVQNPVLALQRGPLEFLIAMIPALAGLVWGVPLAGRLRRYLAARLGR